MNEMNNFMALVFRMRVAQKQFFRFRNWKTLKAASDLEMKVDAFLLRNGQESKENAQQIDFNTTPPPFQR